MKQKSKLIPFEKFQELATNLLSVPKEEVAKEEKKWKKKQVKRTKSKKESK